MSSLRRGVPECAGADFAELLKLARLQCAGARGGHPGLGGHHLPPEPIPHVQPVPQKQRLHLQPARRGLHRLWRHLLLSGPHLHCCRQHQVHFQQPASPPLQMRISVLLWAGPAALQLLYIPGPLTAGKDEAALLCCSRGRLIWSGCCCRGAYRLIIILYAVVCGLWIPLNFWMMPWHALQVGQVCPHRPSLFSSCAVHLQGCSLWVQVGSMRRAEGCRCQEVGSHSE